jgi:steroid delta-isomerase-like uncharacterized protein
MTNPNVALARRWFEEVWNERRSDTVREMLTEESVCHSEAGPMKGPEAFLSQAHAPFLAAFADLHLTVEGTVAEGEQVVVRWRAEGTHTGDGLGVPATGRRVSFRGMTWIRYDGGKMMEGSDCWNQAGLLLALREGQACPSVAVS